MPALKGCTDQQRRQIFTHRMEGDTQGPVGVSLGGGCLAQPEESGKVSYGSGKLRAKSKDARELVWPRGGDWSVYGRRGIRCKGPAMRT